MIAAVSPTVDQLHRKDGVAAGSDHSQLAVDKVRGKVEAHVWVTNTYTNNKRHRDMLRVTMLSPQHNTMLQQSKYTQPRHMLTGQVVGDKQGKDDPVCSCLVLPRAVTHVVVCLQLVVPHLGSSMVEAKQLGRQVGHRVSVVRDAVVVGDLSAIVQAPVVIADCGKERRQVE